MPILIRKNQHGELEGKIEGPNSRSCVLIGKGFRMYHGFRIEYLHFFDKDSTSFLIVLNRVVMTMLYDQIIWDEDGDFMLSGDDDDESEESALVLSEEVSILRLNPNEGAFLLDKEGKVRAGSNTWSDGRLCLGEAYNLFGLDALDLLCTGNPNRDLHWAGWPLQGSFDNINSVLIFTIDLWPVLNTPYSIPPTVYDAIAHFWG